MSLDADSTELAAVREARAKVLLRTKAAEDARSAASTAALLAEEKIALAREMAAADVAEHEAKMDKIYLDARGTYAFDGVARVPTRRGSIILRVQSEDEADAMIIMRDSHRRGAGPTPQEKALAENNAQDAMNRGLRSTVLSGLDHFDTTVKRYHLLWNDLWAARNDLVSGRVLTEGKDAAH